MGAERTPGRRDAPSQRGLRDASPRWRRWAALLGAVAAIVAVMAAAQRWSPAVPGPAAAIYLNNVDREYAPAAYFYTEVTDVAEFVTGDGRYGGIGR